MRTMPLIPALVLVTLATAPLRADIHYAFGQPSYALQPGTSLTVPLELVFTGTDASLLLADGGVLSAAFRIVQSTPAPADPVTLTSLAPDTSDFNDPVLTPLLVTSPASASLWEFADLTRPTGVIGQPLPAGGQSILLSTFTFTAGTTPSQTSFQATRYDAALDTTVTFNSPSQPLDASIAPATVNFTVLPEPGAPLLLISLFIISLTYRRPQSHCYGANDPK